MTHICNVAAKFVPRHVRYVYGNTGIETWCTHAHMLSYINAFMCTLIHTYIHMKTCVCVAIYEPKCVHSYVHACTHTYLQNTYINAHLCPSAYIHTYVWMHLYIMFVGIHTYRLIDVCLHICIQTHIHKLKYVWLHTYNLYISAQKHI